MFDLRISDGLQLYIEQSIEWSQIVIQNIQN